MLQDVIERFRYRFELWRREQGADWKRPTGERVSASSEEKPEDSWQSIPPEKRVILTDSTSRFVVRTLVPYLAILVILVLGCRLLGTFVPLLAYACSIAAIILAILWTLTSVLGTTHFVSRGENTDLGENI
jgi:hypothetical protein